MHELKRLAVLHPLATPFSFPHMHDGKDQERSDSAKKPSDDNAKAEGNIAIVAHD
jgi:hypothetical protein